MNMKKIYILLVICICAGTTLGQGNSFRQVVTLHSSIAHNHDASRSFFDFERGERGTKDKWDLIYGNTRMGDDHDWFSASTAKDNRSLIRDLGELNWTDLYEVPIIEPLPELKEGQNRSITIDASADTGKAWAKNNGIFVKAIVGHLYAMHVKDKDSDFYVLFRVENIERGKSCTISWQLIATPQK